MKFPESNTPKLLLIALFQAFTFYAAFDKIFFQANGLSVLEIAMITFIFSGVIIFLEVPSGALCDRWVRKHVLSLSLISLIVGASIFATGDAVTAFALAVLFNGLAFVLNSGTNNSLLFDSLKEKGAEHDFEKYLAIRRILSGAGFATASLMGGFLAQEYSIPFAAGITIAPLMLALLISCTLREPIFHKTTGELTYFNHMGHTAKHLMSKRYFAHVITLSVVVMSTHLLIEDYSQLYYFAIGFSFLLIGVLSFFEGLKEMLANYLGSIMSTLTALPRHYGFMLLGMSGFLFYAALYQNMFGVIALYTASGLFFLIDVPLLGNFHNQLESKIRATSESFLNLVTELSKMILAAAFALIATHYGITFAFGALGTFVLLYAIYYWMVSIKVLETR